MEKYGSLRRVFLGAMLNGGRHFPRTSRLLKRLKVRSLAAYERESRSLEPVWLFPSKTGTLLDETNVVRASHKITDAAGLPRFRVYDLRHTFASLLLSSNVPLLYVSHQLGLGHTKPTITLKYYARWIPSGQVHRVTVLDTANTAITPQGTNKAAHTL
jgi:integrase